MFHDVPRELCEGYDERYSIERSAFIEMIAYLKKICAIKKLDCLNLKAADDDLRKRVFITFDDVHANVFYNVIPYLLDEKIPFTCFVTIELLDKKGYLSSDELLVLTKGSDSDLCTIGAHGVHHCGLRQCDDRRSKNEIMSSKMILENMTGRKVDYFAYPYGSAYCVGRREERFCNESGYRYAFSAYQLPLNRRYCERRPFMLPRINVNQSNYRKIIKNLEGIRG